MRPSLLRSSNASVLAWGKWIQLSSLDDTPLSTIVRIRSLIKWMLFPGLDLLTRCRYRFLPTFFAAGPLLTLDAGCGNGALSYAAYKLGNTVLGVTADQREVRRNRQFFAYRRVANSHLAFANLNLYDLPQLEATFDQVICSETLEHVRRDALILRHFNTHLKMGGILHLCSPYALHPLNHLGRVDEPEDGSHVRDGYTSESYLQLLDEAGFEIVATAGIGGPIVVTLDRLVRWVRTHCGNAAAIPLFLLVLPFSWLDALNPPLPFSLYVKAIKRRELAPERD